MIGDYLRSTLYKQSITDYIFGDRKRKGEPCPPTGQVYRDKSTSLVLMMALTTAVFTIALDTNIVGNLQSGVL